MSGGLTKILNTKTFEPITYRPLPIGRYGIKVGERPIYGIPYLRNADMKPVDSRISNTPRLGQTSGLPDRRPTTQSGEGHCGQMCKCETPMRGGADADKCEQCGGNIFKDIKEGVDKVGKKIGKAVKKSAKKVKGVAKVVKGVSRVVEEVASTGAAIATALGQPEIAGPLAGVAVAAKGVEEGAKKFQQMARKAQQKSRKMEQEGGVHNPCKKNPGSKDCLSYMKGVRKGKVYLTGGEDEPAVNRFGITPGPRGNDKMSFVATHPMNYRKARLASLMRT